MPWLLRMTLVVSLMMTPAVLYLCWRYFQSGKVFFNRFFKYIIPILLVSFYLFPLSALADYYITGSIDLLTFFKPVVYWFWFGLIFSYQLLTWVLIVDVVKLISSFYFKNKQGLRRLHAQIVLFLLPVVFLFTAWKTYRHTTAIRVNTIELAVEDLPEALHNFRIVHISDIQGDEYTGEENIDRYIKIANKQNPDLIVFTGDLISYGTDFIRMAARELGEAQAASGTVAVVGDHDYWAGSEHVEKALAEQGIPLLQGENYVIRADSSASIVVTGVTEVYSQEADPAVVDSLMRLAEEHEVRVLASHQIDWQLIENANKYQYDLSLAGHTHGGQVRVPFMGMTFSASDLETDFISGVYRAEDLLININNGLGYTLAPVRYNAPAAVSVIILKEKRELP